MSHSVKELPYEVRLRKLGMWSIRADLFDVFKIIHGLSADNLCTSFEYSKQGRTSGASPLERLHPVRYILYTSLFIIRYKAMSKMNIIKQSKNERKKTTIVSCVGDHGYRGRKRKWNY